MKGATKLFPDLPEVSMSNDFHKSISTSTPEQIIDALSDKKDNYLITDEQFVSSIDQLIVIEKSKIANQLTIK